MKTQVIQLDIHDDVISVCDKMAWTKAPRILLVFPHRARILARTFDLLRLKRHAAALGAQLAAVTRSAETRALCTSLGLPAFSTSAAAQRADWGEEPAPFHPQRRAQRTDLRQARETLRPRLPGWQSSFAFRFLFFTLGFLAVAAILLLFLPSATVELTPLTTTQRLTLTVRASPDVTSVNVAGNVPAYSQSATVTGSQTMPTSGMMTVAYGYAAGSVRFENLTESAVGIPAGTVVRTLTSPPVRFATQEDIVLPAGVGEWLEVAVQAVEAGPDGNLSAGTITAIEGGLGASMSVTNPLPMTGGTETSLPTATEVDRLSLQQALMDSLAEECKASLNGLIPADAVYFLDTFIANAVTQTFFPAEGQPGETLSLTMEVECSGQYASLEDLQSLALAALDADLPAGFAPFGEPVILEQGEIAILDGMAEWEMSLERPLRAQVDAASAALLVSGLEPETAVSRLEESLPLTASPYIAVTPAWWPRLPFIPFRITVIEADN
ncbi:MAG: baseplate J/gp47 family protein [Chloroflexota bacterium]